ncbi:MAG: hypothetical protein IE937_03265 [Gammaproteobacteria bacterium]|jgi:hypothetical protein|nr:hypothetical protein [Gammaproteobacteria bacterium]
MQNRFRDMTAILVKQTFFPQAEGYWMGGARPRQANVRSHRSGLQLPTG